MQVSVVDPAPEWCVLGNGTVLEGSGRTEAIRQPDGDVGYQLAQFIINYG